jgi:hypothetical protein
MPELELLKRFAPPPTTPTPEARQAAREALLKRTRRRRFPRPLLLVPALAAAAALIAIAWPDRDPRIDERPATRKPAATGLTPTRALTPGRYIYTRSHGAYLSTVGDGPGYSAMVPSENEVWMALDGTGWTKSRNGKEVWLTDRDRQRWIAAGRPQLFGKGDDTSIGTDDQGGPARMSTPSLPTDPDALFDRLRRDKTPDQTFQAIEEALRQSYTTPAQRAALYDVAGRIPGVTRDSAATDHDGRPGTGFTLDDKQNKMRTELIIDPQTHALIGDEQTTLPGYWNDYKPGTVIGWTVIERVEVVDRIKQRPDAR